MFATFGGKMIDPLVVKHSLLRELPIFSQKVAKRPPWHYEGGNLQRAAGARFSWSGCYVSGVEGCKGLECLRSSYSGS